jgi:uncharacterized protein (TIGR02466 family)
MEIKELFTSPVGMVDIELDADKLCREMNQPNWRQQLVDGQLPADSELKRVTELMTTYVSQYVKHCGFNSDAYPHVAHRVMHKQGHGESAHFHAGGYAATVLYVKTPEGGGDLCLLDPRGPMLWNIMATDEAYGTGLANCRVFKRIQPKSGMLVILPSWLCHYSEKHMGTEPRILIAVDWGLVDIKSEDIETNEKISDLVEANLVAHHTSYV